MYIIITLMNKRQRNIVTNFIFVIVLTIAAIVAMMNFKDYINRAEAIRGMTHLGRVVLKYRQENGAVPGEYYIESIREQLEGGVRMGKIHYRGRWISFGASDNEILAYVTKDYKSIIGKGNIVLRLDGTVEWMNRKEFKELLESQQDKYEKEITPQ